MSPVIYGCSHGTTAVSLLPNSTGSWSSEDLEGLLQCYGCQHTNCEYQWLRLESRYFYRQGGVWLQPVHLPITSPSFELDLLSAYYGGQEVTHQVRDLVTRRQGFHLTAGDNLNQLFGDPKPMVAKELAVTYQYGRNQERLTLRELNGFPTAPVATLPSRGMLRLTHVGGLCNQLMGIATGLLIARKLARVVPLESLAMVVRPTARDDCCDLNLRRPFSDLMDLEALLTGTTAPIDATGQPLPTDVTIEGRAATPGLYSSQIVEVYQRSVPCVAINTPFATVVPSNVADYASIVEVLRACRPNQRLQGYVNTIQQGLGARYNVLHYRYTADWEHKRECIDSVDAFFEHLDSWPFPAPELPTYVCGVLALEARREIQRQRPHIVFKEDSYPEIDLTYEEAAVVDRALALAAEYFTGSGDSTFSLVVVIQRNDPIRSHLYKSDHGLSSCPLLFMRDGSPMWQLPR
jgi:hypothetical protein